MIQFVILSVLLISTCAAKFDKIVELDVLLNEKREFTNAAIFEAGTANNLTVPFKYPLFKQCADAWGEDLMDTKTVCQVGCLMSSTSMGLAGTSIDIPDGNKKVTSNPGTLNSWLRANEGYDGSNDFIEPVLVNANPSRIAWPADAMHKTNDLIYETVCNYIKQGRIVIANVHDGGHFVLLTGFSETDGDTFSVNDPGFNTLTYSYKNDVVGYRIFDMKRN